MREKRFAQFFLIRLDTLKDFKNAKMKFIKFTIFSVSILLKFYNNNNQYVSKMCSKFRIKIMSNKKVTAYQTAIPLDNKVAINSLIADMSWDRGGLSSTKIIFAT